MADPRLQWTQAGTGIQMRFDSAFIVYLIGVAVFGCLYHQLKAAIGSALLFVAVSTVYLLALRALAIWVRQRVEARRTAPPRDKP